MKKDITFKFDSKIYKREVKTKLSRKYYNLWMKSHKFIGVGYQENHFIMRKLWEIGRVACFKLASGDLCFTPYAPNEWNIYDYPIRLNLINVRGVSFIPTKSLKVDEEVVIGYALPDMNPIRDIVDVAIDEIVTAKMTIMLNLFSHKMPFVINVTPQDRERIKSLFARLMDDDPALYCDIDDINALQTLITGTPYIIDKLTAHIQTTENQLLTQLGIDNVAFEKKERMNQDEINSNNVLINMFANAYQDELTGFCERATTILKPNLPLQVESMHDNAMAEMLKRKESEDNGNEQQ